MGGRNELLVAMVTFVATMLVVSFAWILYGVLQEAPPPLPPVANVSDPSQATRPNSGPKATEGINLAAARNRIADLEQALQSRDQIAIRERKKAQQAVTEAEQERRKLLETIVMLEDLLANAVNSDDRERPAPKTAEKEGEPEEMPPLTAEPLIGNSTPEPDNDAQDNREQLTAFIERLNAQNARLATASREVVVLAGQSAVDGLVQKLASRDPAIQLWALQALAQIGPMASEAADAVEALRDHPLPEVADAARVTLQRILD